MKSKGQGVGSRWGYGAIPRSHLGESRGILKLGPYLVVKLGCVPIIKVSSSWIVKPVGLR